VAWLASRADTPPPDAPAASSATALAATLPAAPEKAGPFQPPAGPLTAAAREAALQQARLRLARAEQTLQGYRAATQYPFGSRPAAEHSDQMNPHAPITTDQPLRMPRGAPASGMRVQTTQERVFISGNDSSRFTVTVVDDAGTPLPVQIVRSIAHEPDATSPSPMSNGRAPPPPSPIVPVPFTDDGTGGDARAGDGTWSATLSPAALGFGAFPGSIRTELTLQVGDAQGFVAFDVVYAPNQPASWTGRTREALEGGSLNLYLGANVQQAGRYVVTGRVDDANGKPFALVTFNDELAAGAREVRLTVFGRLVRDQKPAFPLTLRDVDGFLLKQDTFPDRDLMPRLDGVVLTTKRYLPTMFSAAEWQGDEKNRYLAEYQRDVDLAQRQVDLLAGAGTGAAAPPTLAASGP
jgi:hypothetical protein